MENKILFIGLDVDDKNYHAHAIVENENVGIDFRSKPNIHSLIKMIKEKFKDNYTFHFCYEASVSFKRLVVAGSNIFVKWSRE